MKENRGSRRYDVDIEVELGGRRARVKNLSLGGMFILTDEKLEVGARVQLAFAIPGQRIETAAIVRWRDGTGTGVQFDGLRARDVWALGKYFEQL